jgi:hypothetical protein
MKNGLPMFLNNAITEASVPLQLDFVKTDKAAKLQLGIKTSGVLASIIKSKSYCAISTKNIQTYLTSNNSLNRTRKNRVPVSSARWARYRRVLMMLPQIGLVSLTK